MVDCCVFNIFDKNIYIMKKITYTSILILIAFLATTHTTEAQIWKNLESKVKDKVEKKASKKLESKIDKSIDKSFDKTEEALDESTSKKNKKSDNKSNTPEGIDYAKMLGGNAEARQSYVFELGVSYQTTTVSAKNRKEVIPESTLWYSKEGYIGMNASDSKDIIVMDTEKDAMVIFQDKEKQYMTLGSGIQNVSSDENDDVDANYKIEKIGTEKILGYNCDIYKVSGTDYNAKIWMTKALNFDYSKILANTKNKQNTLGTSWGSSKNFPQGMLLKMESTDTKTKEKTFTEATKVHKTGTTIKTSSYKKAGL
jgi:hypothetical protein